jgi:aspartyl protease family protein
MSQKNDPEQIVDDVLKRISNGSIHREQRKIKVWRIAALLVVVLIIVIAVIDTPPSIAPNLAGVADVRTKVQTDGDIHVQISANREGHHVFAGRINDLPVKFFLDTGSSTVSIPLAVANHLKLPLGEPYQATTAGGTVLIYATIIERLEIGGITANNVRGAILTEMNDDRISLGMTFLRAFELDHNKGELTLIKAAP